MALVGLCCPEWAIVDSGLLSNTECSPVGAIVLMQRLKHNSSLFARMQWIDRMNCSEKFLPRVVVGCRCG